MPASPRLIHGDTQSSNVIVRGPERAYATVIDWGGACWGDPAHDFAGIPLRAIPYMLEGYREVSPSCGVTEAGILWRHLQLALYTARRGPQPTHSWAERPLTMPVEILRFFLRPPSPTWADLRPRSA